MRTWLPAVLLLLACEGGEEMPSSGFTVDVTVLDDPADPIDRASLSLVASAAFGGVAPGQELVDRLLLEERGVTRGRWLVGVDEALPAVQIPGMSLLGG